MLRNTYIFEAFGEISTFENVFAYTTFESFDIFFSS